MLTYIIALLLIAVLLYSAIRIHLAFGIHRENKVEVKGNVPHATRSPLLRDLIYEGLAE